MRNINIIKHGNPRIRTHQIRANEIEQWRLYPALIGALCCPPPTNWASAYALEAL